MSWRGSGSRLLISNNLLNKTHKLCPGIARCKHNPACLIYAVHMNESGPETFDSVWVPLKREDSCKRVRIRASEIFRQFTQPCERIHEHEMVGSNLLRHRQYRESSRGVFIRLRN